MMEIHQNGSVSEFSKPIMVAASPRHSGEKNDLQTFLPSVGSGFIGQVHAASLARHEGSALTMVADAAPERAQALAARYGARAVTVSEAIHSDAIDAVLIASSTPSHAELLEAAAEGGQGGLLRKTDRPHPGARP